MSPNLCLMSLQSRYVRKGHKDKQQSGTRPFLLKNQTVCLPDVLESLLSKELLDFRVKIGVVHLSWGHRSTCTPCALGLLLLGVLMLFSV